MEHRSVLFLGGFIQTKHRKRQSSVADITRSTRIKPAIALSPSLCCSVLSCSAVAVVVVFLLLQRTLALRPTPLLVAASLPLLRSPSLTRPPPLLSLSCTSCLAQSLWLACSLAVSPSSLSWCFVGMSLWCGFVCAYLSYCPLHPPSPHQFIGLLVLLPLVVVLRHCASNHERRCNSINWSHRPL
jgi:hypothetical protein